MLNSPTIAAALLATSLAHPISASPTSEQSALAPTAFTLCPSAWWRSVLTPAGRPGSEAPEAVLVVPMDAAALRPQLPAVPPSPTLELIAASPESALAILPALTAASTAVHPDPPIAQLLAPIEQSLAQLWSEMQRQRADRALTGGPSLSDLRDQLVASEKDRKALEATVADLESALDDHRRALADLSIVVSELQRRLDRFQRTSDAPLPR